MPDDPNELFEVVDENDCVTGSERRGVVHTQGLRHRSVHVLVVNSAGDLLIQLRSAGKDQYPGFWDVSVGGHVAPGETYQEAARRELKEEMNLEGDTLFLRKTAASTDSGWEFNCLYLLATDDKPTSPPGEIDRVEYVEPDRLLEQIESGLRCATPALANALRFYLGKGLNNSRG